MKLSYKILITSLLFVVIYLRINYPKFLDNTTLIILFIILIVWSFNWIRRNVSKVKVGDFEIEIENEEIKNTVSRVQLTEKDISIDNSPINIDFTEEDSNLLLVKFRIEIEKRLRELYESSNEEPDKNLSLIKVLLYLEKCKVINNTNFVALKKIIEYGNMAAHGALVDNSIQNWAKTEFTRIIEELDWLIFQFDSENLIELSNEFDVVLKRLKPVDHKYIYHILFLAIKDNHVKIGPHYNLQKYELAQLLSEFKILQIDNVSMGKEYSHSKFKVTPIGKKIFNKVKELHDSYESCEFCFPAQSKGELFFT